MKNEVLKPNASRQFLANHNITWKFITERAPWWRELYERLVGLVKRCLKKTIDKAYLNMIELNTILTEVEVVLNGHPLTYPYADIKDASPLTPSHFLCGHRPLTLLDTRVSVKESYPDYIPTDISTKELTKRAKYHKIVIQAFWTRWQKEYLTSLREYNSYQKKTSIKTAVVIGDVVLIHDNIPRNQWKIGFVTDLHEGKDGLVGAVSLRVSSGGELLRPIEKLYPSEMSSENNAQGIEKEDKEAIADKQRPTVRLASQRAIHRIREQSEKNT